MTNPRRVALWLIAAQLVAAPLAFAQAGRQQGAGQGGASGGGGGADDEEEDEEDEEEDEEEPARGPQQQQQQQQAPARPGAPGAQAPWDFVREETEEQAAARRERMLPRFSALDGQIGLLHMGTAEAGSDQSFRFGLIAETWSGGGFLRPMGRPGTACPPTMPMCQDEASHIGATLTLSYSPIRYLEVFSALRSYANFNDQERPQLFQVLGDANLGVKGIYPVLRGLNVGLSAAAYVLNRAGGIGVSLDSTSFDVRALSTLDIQQFAPTVPVRVHLNLGYYFDNSASLVADVERRRQMADPRYNAADCNMEPSTDPRAPRNNNPACHVQISRVERYALGINRADRFSVNVGVDANLPYVRPFVEANFGVPVVRSGYICWQGSTGAGDDDACLGAATTNQFAATPSTLTLGARVLPPIRGLSALVAFDIAMGGSNTFVRELAPITPWMFFFGAGYAHDFAPLVRRVEVVREVERRVEVDRTPVQGVIVGTVTDAETHQPVPNAIIDFVGHPDFGLLATSAQGSFRSRPLPPADYELHVRAPDYNDNTCRGTIPAPQGESRTVPDVTVNCELRPVPRMGNIAGRVTNAQNNQPVANVPVTLTPGAGIVVPQGQTAPAAQTVQTGPDGAFQFQNLPAGQYNVGVGQGPQTRAVAPRSVDVRPRETTNADIQVAPVDERGIRITRGAISVRESIHFQTDSAEILPDSQTLLERIADFINRHPEARRIEIQGHTDNQGTPAHNMTLSQNRAEAVRAALINLGVDADRLTARGFGQTRPIAPNLTPAGRARNRRVVFAITERGPATPAP